MFETSTPLAGQKRKRATSNHQLHPTPQPRHPYLTGNFAPIHQTLPLTPCTYTGTIPEELADGEYVRNGSNPVSNDDLGRDAHWFDGDGMLAGVSFRKDQNTGTIEPEFVNQFVLTDLYLSTISSPQLKVPILPSIATLVNPLASILYVGLRVLRTVLLVILSFLSGSRQKIKKISVANTSIVYHDGRALATCESGPPMRIQLPGLETVGWYTGSYAEGELSAEEEVQRKEEAALRKREGGEKTEEDRVLGEDSGLLSFMREWTTAHPKVDPVTKEMMMFHSSFAPPYVQYSILPQQQQQPATSGRPVLKKLLNAAVPGIHGAKMMHDFGVSLQHTIIMDLPLSLDPTNQLVGKPPVSYDSSRPSRFGVFPRRHPEQVQWYETDGCCIFHTANTWDTVDAFGKTSGVSMLACRLTSATLIFATGNIAPPVEKPKSYSLAPVEKEKQKRMSFFAPYDADTEASVYERANLLESPRKEKEAFIRLNETVLLDAEELDEHLWDEDQCRLYYYDFSLTRPGEITSQWALAAIPFEFPSVRPDKEMRSAQYVYGCSTSSTSFGSALGKATKIDVLGKVDTQALISRGQQHPPRSVTGAVDNRSMTDILASDNPNDPIQGFQLPEGWFAQEPRFVPASTNASEDDGWLLFYAFDESQLTVSGDVPPDTGSMKAKSELWVVDAKSMKHVVARVHLPQRVPYGLHGSWFSAEDIKGQREVDSIRTTAKALEKREEGTWMVVRDWVERILA